MKLNTIKLQAFCSFQKQQTLLLNRPPGLYMLAGDNRSEPNLASNGSGKSTIWDSVCWCLFGKTPRGLKASSIRNWSAPKELRTEVIVDFSIDDKDYSLLKSWKPNNLLLSQGEGDPKSITQEELEDFLNLSMDAFLTSILISQFGTHFLDRGIANRTVVFSSLLNLDKWTDLISYSRKYAKQHMVEIDNLKSDLDSLKGRLEGVRTTKYDSQKREWSSTQQYNLKFHKKEMTKLDVKTERVKSEKKRLERVVEKQSSAVEELEPKIKQFRAKVDVLNSKLQAHSHVIMDLQTQSRLKTKEISHVKALEGTCSECFQKISRDQKETLLTKLNKALDSIIQERENVDRKVKVNTKRLTELNRNNEYTTQHEQALEKLSNAKERVRQCNSDLNTHQVNYNLIHNLILNDIDTIENKKNPFDTLIQEQTEEIVRIKELIKKTKKKYSDRVHTHEQIQYWADIGFKSIQTQLMEASAKEFEIEMLKSLDLLGLETLESKSKPF